MSDLGCKAQTLDFHNKIAIVQRGNCTFSTALCSSPSLACDGSTRDEYAGTKVQNAQQAGARAVLVWNHLGDFYVYVSVDLHLNATKSNGLISQLHGGRQAA
jgi:hypothetical protein